ncbi:MAG: sulfite exporter TauE/SafE family protein [Pseudoxanthomonas suwonensis]|nr:MAG: sulfite exporter TauE/SafE family protein [Pseudoxanthomonas suwonensis]
MPIDWLVLGSAWLAGLLGGVHCAAMCGGIATGFSALSARNRWIDAAAVNLGRVSGYVLAGMIAGGVGGGILRLARLDWLALGSRMLVGVVLIIAALRLLGVAGRGRFATAPGAALWQQLRPLQQRLLPLDSLPKRWAAGVLWGWLPCGLSVTMLTAAWFQASAWHGGLTMAVFGLGTLPLMIPLTWSGARALRWLQRPPFRAAAGVLVLLAGVLTLAAPWLMQVPALHGVLQALGCRTLPAG